MATTTASLWIPDLVLEIASHLSDRDISRLSECNRMSRELTMPLLFRTISITLPKVTSVSYVLDKYPHYACRCSSFTFEGSTRGLTSAECKPLFESLATVLLVLADHARVRSVWWREEPFSLRGAVPTSVWKALGKLSGSLQELRIFIDENWHAICALEYPQLRTLDIWAWTNSGLDYSTLQVMLNGLSQLEHLSLHLPFAEPGLELSSYHSHLRTFGFTGKRLPSSFVNRHPTIECIAVKLTATDGSTLGDSDLPQLNALCVDGRTISSTPSLLSPRARRPITHLQLDSLNDPTPTTIDIPVTLQRVGNVHATLRHLDLRWSIKTFGQYLAECSTLFQILQQLEELTVQSDPVIAQDPLCEEDLVKVLLSLRDSTSIAHLRLSDIHGYPLSEIFLSDMGTVPASLKHLTWEIPDKFTYRLESRNGKTVAIPSELPYSGEAGPAWDFDYLFFGLVLCN